MIEADKMLHLRKYVLTVLRNDTKSRVARSLYSTSAREGGYVFRSLYHCYIPRANSRPNHIVCGVRTFSTTLTQSSVDEVGQKLTSFCDDVKQGQTWSADRLKEVIRLCDENNHQLQSSTGVLLLKCCGNLLSTVESDKRQDLTDQVWQLAKKNSSALTLEHYNTLLNVHAENCSSVDPKKFLADMDVQPNDDTYRLLFNTVAKTGNIKHLQSVISMVQEKNILFDEEAFCTLMQNHLAKGNITEAQNIIKLVQDAKLPVNKLYTELACKYAAQSDIPNLVKTLNDEPQSDVNLLKIIKSLSLSGNSKDIPVITNLFTGSVSTIKSEVNNLIIDLVRADRAMDAHAIINYFAMNKENAEHTTSFINNFLNQLIMMNVSAEDITKFASDFVKSEHELLALNNIAETSLKLGREKLSLTVFAAMRQKGMEIRAHYYWPLLLNAQQNEGEAKVFSLLASMKTMDVEIDFDTLVGFVLPYVNTSNPIITLQRLKMNGIHNNLLSTPMIFFLLSRHRLQDVSYLYEHGYHNLEYKVLIKPLVHVYFATRDVENCVKVFTTFTSGLDYISLFLIHLLRSNSPKLRMEEFQTLLETFDKHGAKFSPRDATLLKNKVDNFTVPIETSTKLCRMIDQMTSEELEFSVLTIIPHPRYMSTNELVCHLVELKNQGRGTRNVLQRLLQAYYIEDNLKKAEEVRQEFDKNQYPWTSGMKMQIFYLYVKHNKLKEAEALLLEIQDIPDTFLIDSNKILLFATALVKAGKSKMAFDVIENFSNVNNKKSMSVSCAKLLTALSESKHYNNMEDMLHLLIQKNYCKVSTELLRPLIAIFLKRNDIPSMVETLANCERLYKKLPLALEVFTALLRAKDEQMPNIDKYIEKVYNMIMNAKSVEAANTVVVIALAILNKMEELRIILQKQRIATNTLMYYFSYVQKINDPNPLLRILEASQNSDNVNQFVICDTLLTLYSKTSDHKGALALWELMHAKNIKVQKSFKQAFIEFFQLNKIPLPAEFESDISKVNISNQ